MAETVLSLGNKLIAIMDYILSSEVKQGCVEVHVAKDAFSLNLLGEMTKTGEKRRLLMEITLIYNSCNAQQTTFRIPFAITNI